MPKFIVRYWEKYVNEYEVEADDEDEAWESVRNDIYEGRRKGPDSCVDSGYEVEDEEGKSLIFFGEE